MSFAGGMSAGANLYRSAMDLADRRRFQKGGMQGFTTRPPSEATASLARDERSTKDPQGEAMKTAQYLESREQAFEAGRDLRERRKTAEQEGQAQDFQIAAAALAVGDANLAQDYINRYGDPRMNVSIAQGEGGRFVVTPSSGKTMEFGDARELYTNFFGLLRPKGSDFALPQAAAQSWKAFGDADAGFHVLDEKSGNVRRVTPGMTPGGKERRGAGSGAGAKNLDNNAYKLMIDQVNKQFLAEVWDALPDDQKDMAAYMETDALGNQRVDMNRVFSKMPPEMRERYNKAVQAGAYFMTDSEMEPIRAGNDAYQYSRQPRGVTLPQQAGEQGVSPGDIDKVSPARLNVLYQGLKNAEADGQEEAMGFLDELRQASPAEFAALARRLKDEGRPGLEVAPQKQKGTAAMNGMTPPASSPKDVLGQIRTNAGKGIKDSGWNPDYPVELMGEGLSALWKVAPARLVTAGISGKLKDFQRWARAGGFNQADPTALREYAKVDPEGAAQIAEAAVRAAQ